MRFVTGPAGLVPEGLLQGARERARETGVAQRRQTAGRRVALRREPDVNHGRGRRRLGTRGVRPGDRQSIPPIGRIRTVAPHVDGRGPQEPQPAPWRHVEQIDRLAMPGHVARRLGEPGRPHGYAVGNVGRRQGARPQTGGALDGARGPRLDGCAGRRRDDGLDRQGGRVRPHFRRRPPRDAERDHHAVRLTYGDRSAAAPDWRTADTAGGCMLTVTAAPTSMRPAT